MSRSRLAQAIAATRQEDYLLGLTLFVDVYGSEEAPPLSDARMVNGLSYFGLCIALVQRKYKPAIDLCMRAISLQFYSGDHYANLTRVYLAAGNRKKAIETADAGLRASPDHEGLSALRNDLGVRARPALPFLERRHPINVSIGRVRHNRKGKKD